MRKSKSVSRAAVLRRVRVIELAQIIIQDMCYSEIKDEADKYRVNLFMRGMTKTLSVFRRLA